MNAEAKVAKQRLSVLELAEVLGNVSEACRRRGMTRAHEAYLSLGSSAVVGKLQTGGAYQADVKSTFDSTDLERAGIDVWRL